MAFNSDSDLDVKVRKATERISENMHIVANEPSLAFYRLQEHVLKALNPMVDRRVDVNRIHTELQGRCYDIEYAVGALKGMSRAEDSFKNIQDNLKNAIFLKQQLKYEESRRKKLTVVLYTNDFLLILLWTYQNFQSYPMLLEKQQIVLNI
ncbi:hypothetical protein NQ317_009757 [Molorchus minor]|uniref:BLOC-1-related complex subunit 8 n=1 Tax=Molorchus minor TaxID=1323400 RepID=A0ABQ9K0Z8_9CUCU|nr:hypothetical protein NQ317_009757 [Molorchus minor]